LQSFLAQWFRGGFFWRCRSCGSAYLNRPWMGIDARWSLPIAAIWIAATLFVR